MPSAVFNQAPLLPRLLHARKTGIQKPMHTPISRRAWLSRTASASLAAVALSKTSLRAAEETLPRAGGKARMKLSLAAYSFRDFFKEGARGGKTIDMFDFVDFCADHQCDGAEVTSYYFPKDTDRAYLLKLKRHAFLRGVALSGTAVGNTFTFPAGADRDRELSLVKKWVDQCVVLGAPHIRVFAGAVQKGDTGENAIKNSIETLKQASAYAAEHGIFLGLENHGGIVAEAGPLLEIVKAVNNPWLGINLDSGNFHTEDPYGDFAKCVPYAVNVQIKTEVHPKGKGTERADLKRFIEILREAKYQGYVALEFEEKSDPWERVPAVLRDLHKLIHAA
jgi:sugar phosphate isomerase/epimerase